jgi:nucleotide-binding universal stress UspA family protein
MLPKINTIIYACDLENQTQAAMELVLNLANLHKAKIILMHVMEPLNTQASNMISSYISEEVIASMRKDAQKDIHSRMEEMLNNYMQQHAEELSTLEYPPEILTTSGAPSDCIQQTAKAQNADLIVMNSRTHSRLGQMILGSTANKVIHSSTVPVLVVPIK